MPNFVASVFRKINVTIRSNCKSCRLGLLGRNRILMKDPTDRIKFSDFVPYALTKPHVAVGRDAQKKWPGICRWDCIVLSRTIDCINLDDHVAANVGNVEIVPFSPRDAYGEGAN